MSKPKPHLNYVTPAPGDYKINYAQTIKDVPGFSFGIKGPLKITEKTPGPGAYKDYRAIGDQFTSNYVTLPKTSIPKSARQPLYNKNNTPGPGAYKGHSDFNSGRGHSFSLSDRDAFNYMYVR